MNEPFLTAGEAEALLLFLDRVQITGHKERHAMTVVANKIATLMPQPNQPAAPPVPPADSEEGSGAEIGA